MIKTIISQSNDPTYNLATEEFLTSNYQGKEPIFFIWQNANTIVIGRNQNTVSEINLERVQRDKVNVVRRNTGGGTVFQDMGNICYSIIIPNSKEEDDGFESMLQPILKFLQTYNLNAQFSGRNDIQINDYKISGNAKLRTQEKTLLHGTLMFDVELSKIGDYLVVKPEKIQHQKVKSKISRVKNIKEFLREEGLSTTVDKFTESLFAFYEQTGNTEPLHLTKENWEFIENLAENKFRNWDWTYGKHGDFSFRNAKYLEQKGLIEVNMEIKTGIIKDIKIYGDFLGYKGTQEVEQALINQKYDIETIKKIVSKIDLSEIFAPNFGVEDLIELMF